MFQLSQLRCFVAVATELHFGRAAATLNMTQPPLTRQIQLLEHELGVQLLERAGGSVRLTPAGSTFLLEAEDILRRAQAARLAAQRATRGDAGSITMGFVPPASFALLPRLLAALRSALPEVHPSLREMQTDDQLEALGTDRIDLAVVRPFMPRTYVESAVLLREPMVLAMPSTHRLKGDGPLPLSSIDGQAFIEYSPSETRYLYEMVAGRLRSEGIAPEIVQSLSHTHTILSLVDAGMGIALVPQSARRLRFEHVLFRLVDDDAALHAELHLAWRRGKHNGLVANVRKALLHEFFQAPINDSQR